MSDQRRTKELVSADMAIVSQYAIKFELKSGLLCEDGYWALHGQSEWSGPEHGVIEGLWRWLLIWGLEHPRALVSMEWQLRVI